MHQIKVLIPSILAFPISMNTTSTGKDKVPAIKDTAIANELVSSGTENRAGEDDISNVTT